MLTWENLAMATVRFQPTSLNPLLVLAGIPHGKFVITRRGSGAFGFLNIHDEDTSEFVTIDEAIEVLAMSDINPSKIDGHIADLHDNGIPQNMRELINRLCACTCASSPGHLVLSPVTGMMWPLPFMRVKGHNGLDGTIINTVVEAYDEALQQTRAGNCTAYDGVNMVKAAAAYGLPLDQMEYSARYNSIPKELRKLFEGFAHQMAMLFMTYATHHVHHGFPFLAGLGTDPDNAMTLITCDPRGLLQAMPNPGQMAKDLQARLEATAVQPDATANVAKADGPDDATTDAATPPPPTDATQPGDSA